MSGAGVVVALVLLEWSAGLVAAGGWTQSWSVVRRGHFRILGWTAVLLALLGALAARSTAPSPLTAESGLILLSGFGVALATYLVVQRAETDHPGALVAYAAGLMGSLLLVVAAGAVAGWPQALAAAQVLAGAALLGAVTNGMLLGHWYLNQPGLKPWALGRLTNLALVAVALTGVAGTIGASRLTSATTEGASLGLPGASDTLAPLFFATWLLLLAFTGVVVFLARRCVSIRSIQSATGLYYVAILTAGVSEFLVRYLMVGLA